MIENYNELFGRLVGEKDVPSEIKSAQNIKKMVPIKVTKNEIYCKRCGHKTSKNESQLPNDNFYCPNCINLGRMTLKEPLCFIEEPNLFSHQGKILTWDGKLTKEQEKCSNQIIEVINNNQTHLLWAVTGAGKTEMLFKGIAQAIKDNKRVCIASPRVDVCVELFPRIQDAFKNISVVLLHGKSSQSYFYSQLTICTTHQLLRFYHAFDVIIIDEVDSFPFVNDESLHFAVDNAVKDKSAKLYLTATPTAEMIKKIKRKQISASYLPIRFHRHLLPEATIKYVNDWRKLMKKHKLPSLLLNKIKQKIKKRQRFLLFIPKIDDLPVISEILATQYDSSLWHTVYSSDELRMEKVNDMRTEKVLFLITTTILERGVTFPGIDVIVLGADDEVFTMSSLVQIAGRVGRKKDRPTGEVLFIVDDKTKPVNNAMKQIKYMNRLAKKLNE
ncbi:helicase-related protein [Apilactobacillus apinorum]|uniref:DEAD/DEAH box helicase n=1 Tax=Apilactobacillus apinorum TaxID=1218495 RepID=UPI0030EA9292